MRRERDVFRELMESRTGLCLSFFAGTSDHDDNRSALRRIMREWKRAKVGYLDRVDHLQNGGGLNGNVHLNNSTVLNDGAADLLFGQLNRD